MKHVMYMFLFFKQIQPTSYGPIYIGLNLSGTPNLFIPLVGEIFRKTYHILETLKAFFFYQHSFSTGSERPKYAPKPSLFFQ